MVPKAWHALETEQVIKELDSDIHQGLAEPEVKNRIEQYGYNELKKEKRISPFALFLSQFKNILMIILLIAIVLSAVVGEYIDAAVIAVIVIFCAVLGFVQEYRASQALEALKKMLSPVVTVLRGGKEEEISSRDLVPGDILLVEAGDRVAADARLVEIHSLMCDEAPLTGESVPVNKDTASLAEIVPVSERSNMVFTGTTVTYGRGKAVVTGTGMNTEFGKIAEQVSEVKTEETPLEKRTGEIGKWLGIMALSICVVLVVVSLVREGFWGAGIDMKFIVEVVMFAIALAVAAVPEALPAIVTGALAIGVHQMAQRNALVRKMPAVETLGCTTVICSDKTGTLTRGEMTVRQLFTGGRLIEVTGSGYTPTGEFRSAGGTNVTSNKALQSLLLGGLLCNDAVLAEKDGKWSIKGDPTEGALVVIAAKAGLHPAETRLEKPRIEEIPFSSERKRMTTINNNVKDGGSVAFMKGAPEMVLERCTHILNEDGTVAPLETSKTEIQKQSEAMSQRALRVLGLAYRDMTQGVDYQGETVENNMVFLGLVGMMDPPREEAVEAIKQCKQVGIKPVMITGDHQLTAVAVAREMGIFSGDSMVLTGAELENMPDEELEKIVDKVAVYARVSPSDKLKIVKAWKARGEVVAMTGDGVNDAPALKHADIGIAMGITGTDVTKEAADMVLSDDNFATIVKAVERGRWIYDNIKKYLTYLLQCNIVEVLVIGGIVLWMGPKFLPLLPAAILYINLATDGLPALALGVSPPDPDVMLRPPRSPKESVFSRDVRFFMLPAIVVQTILFYFLFFHQLGGIEGVTNARTELFFLFIIVEFVVAINCRSLIFSVLKARPHKWLLIALAWEIVLIALLVQFNVVRQAFGIHKPSIYDLGIVIGMAVLVFLVIEVTKTILRKKIPAGRVIPG